MKLSESWDVYAADMKLRGLSPVTIGNYRVQHNLLLRYFGDVAIEGITLVNLKNYLIEESGHLKPSSLGQRVRSIRAFFKWATLEEYIEKNPALKLKEPKEGSRVPKALSEEDLELLREGCTSAMEHALIEFLFATGCRVGEVNKLSIKDIDWDNHSCVVLGKGDKEREVYFGLRCALWLKRYLKQRKDSDESLFVTQRAPHRLSVRMIEYVVNRIANQSETQVRVYPHKLRHTFAMHLVNNGAPLEGIQTLLGHAKLETTQIYAHLSGPRRKAIFQKYF